MRRLLPVLLFLASQTGCSPKIISIDAATPDAFCPANEYRYSIDGMICPDINSSGTLSVYPDRIEINGIPYNSTPDINRPYCRTNNDCVKMIDSTHASYGYMNTGRDFTCSAILDLTFSCHE